MRIGDAAAASGGRPTGLDLLDSDQLPRHGEACAGTAGIVQHRIAALDAEIARLTQLRNQLAARIVPAQRAELAS
jgi:MerR family copper efflux transcriptional regulator